MSLLFMVNSADPSGIYIYIYIYICTISVNIKKSYIFPTQRISAWCVVLKTTGIISLHHINILVSSTETKNVYCAVRNLSSIIIKQGAWGSVVVKALRYS